MINKILMAARKLTSAGGRDEQQHADLELVSLVADYFNPGRSSSHCRKCGAPLVWIKTAAGANAPLDATPIDGVDADGEHHRIRLSHFSTCPRAAEVRRETDEARR